jgi:hypothetical protein
MAKFSKKMMGKEVGNAATYAVPHDMSGKPFKMASRVDPNTLTSNQITPATGSGRVSAGNPARDDVKTSGIKMRGTGAATKGVMSRGPMG